MRKAPLVVLLALFPGVSGAMGPFEKNHPLVEQGTAAYAGGRFDEALAAFDEAGKERPADARVQYNRALALHKLGRQPEARQALERAEEFDRAHELTSKLHYTRGNIAAMEGDDKTAVKEYRGALRSDPADVLARHNLEVLLRRLPPKSQAGPDGGAPDGGPRDAGSDGGTHTDAGADGGSPDAGRQDGGPSDGGQADGGAQPDAGHDGGSDGGSAGDGGHGDGGAGDAGSGEQDHQGDAGRGDSAARSDAGADGGGEQSDAGGADEAAAAEPGDGGANLSKGETEKLLDALKSKEKNLQLWRYRQPNVPRKPDTHGKDW